EYQGEPRLLIETLHGEDGLIVPRAPYDSAHGAVCLPREGAVRRPCLLGDAAQAEFADDRCLRPAALVDASCPRPPAGFMPTASCPQTFELGDVEQAAVVYHQDVDVCRRRELQRGAVYPLGERFDPPELVREPGTGATREVPLYAA